MKKVMFLMAVAGMFAFAACNNNTPAEEVEDTTAIEAVEEEVAEDAEAVEAEAEVETEAAEEAVAE